MGTHYGAYKGLLLTVPNWFCDDDSSIRNINAGRAHAAAAFRWATPVQALVSSVVAQLKTVAGSKTIACIHLRFEFLYKKLYMEPANDLNKLKTIMYALEQKGCVRAERHILYIAAGELGPV